MYCACSSGQQTADAMNLECMQVHSLLSASLEMCVEIMWKMFWFYKINSKIGHFQVIYPRAVGLISAASFNN